MHEFGAQLANGLALGAIYALIALGYTMVYGIVELINFAHGDIYTFGSFVTLAILTALGVTGEAHGVLLVVAVLVAILGSALACGVLAMLIERVAYRPLRNAPRLAPLITAIGVSFILENALQLWKGPAPITIPALIPNPRFLGGMFSLAQIAVIVLAVVTMFALQMLVHRTRLGMQMRAVAQDRDAAALVGIDANRTIALTFLIAGALAGIAGMASGVYYQSTWFLNGFGAGLKSFTAAVLGGIGNIAGAMLGGFCIGILEAFTTATVGGQWANVAVFTVLIGVLVIRPNGILGTNLPDKL